MSDAKFGEPWQVDRDNCHIGQIATCHGERDGYAEVWTPRWGADGVDTTDQYATALRITTCVNVLEGIDDPEAHMERLRKIEEAADMLREYHKTPSGLVGPSTLSRLLSAYDKACSTALSISK